MTAPLAPACGGVVATPFAGFEPDIDEASLSRLVQHYQRAGVTGLPVLRLFGEAARLSAPERRTVLEVVFESADLPLVIGAGEYYNTAKCRCPAR